MLGHIRTIRYWQAIFLLLSPIKPTPNERTAATKIQSCSFRKSGRTKRESSSSKARSYQSTAPFYNRAMRWSTVQVRIRTSWIKTLEQKRAPVDAFLGPGFWCLLIIGYSQNELRCFFFWEPRHPSLSLARLSWPGFMCETSGEREREYSLVPTSDIGNKTETSGSP